MFMVSELTISMPYYATTIYQQLVIFTILMKAAC